MINEKVHPVTGEKYIEGKRRIIMESGVVLAPAEFAQTTMMTKEEVGALMQELSEREDRFKFDYKYALTTGILRHYQKKPEGNQGIVAEISPKPVAKLQKPKVQRKLSPALIILLVMCTAGIMSACMSAYHTTLAMRLFGRPLAAGLITGIVMILFSATAFTAARWFWQEKGFVRGFAFIFILLGAMVIAYSMMSTLVVNYKAWANVEETERVETAGDSEELKAYEAQIKLKTEELDEAVATEKAISEEAEWWKNRSWKRYDELSEQLTEQRKKVSVARSELSSLLSSKPQIASRVIEQREDVFTFLSGFIKIQPKTLRLFMQAVPAMFFDIIAPFALSCAIYLAEKRKEDGTNA